MSCDNVSRNNTLIVNSGNIIWNGSVLPICLGLSGNEGFNDILLALSNYVCQLSVPTILGTDDVMSDVEYTICTSSGGTIIPANTALTTILTDITEWMCDVANDLVVINNEIITINDYIDNSVLVGNGSGTTSIVLPPMTVLGNIGDGVEPVDRDGLIFIEKLVTYNDTYDYIKPYTDGYHFAVGDGTDTNRTVLRVLDSNSISGNPQISFFYNASLPILGYSNLKGFTLNYGSERGFCSYSGKIGIDDINVAYMPFLNYSSVCGQSQINYTNWSLITYAGTYGSSDAFMRLNFGSGTSCPWVDDLAVFNVDASGISFFGTTAIMGVLDEDNFVSDSPIHVPTQQSTKAYIDSLIPATPALQSELDTTQLGIGCNTNGTYNTPAGTSYIDGTTSVMDALETLDAEINRIETLPLTADGAGALRQLAVFDFDYSDLPLTGQIVVGTNLIPINSILTNVWVDVITTFQSDDTVPNTTTIGLVIDNEDPYDINVASQVGTFYTSGIKIQGVLSFSSSTPIKLSGNRVLKVIVSNGAGVVNGLTAGSMRIFVEYLNSR